MIISRPDKFFVPVILLENYNEFLDIGEVKENPNGYLLRNNKDKEFKNINREFLEDKTLDYIINEYKNVSREFLADKIFRDKDIEAEIYEEILNIGAETIEYYILKYVTAFMVYERELEAQGCTDINREEFLKQIQLYVESLKELYNEFLKLKNSIKIPLSLEDQKAIEDYFIEKIEVIYSKQFANIKCKEKEQVIDNNIEGIIEETRVLIRNEIKKINQDILDGQKDSVIKDEAYFKNLEEIYDSIDKET
ncbi:hypothetical protein [Clostridium sp.]|uniref:hypothetical protein n=1 Tax=Clostridium sp. TaxID=1506 RepID=UPI002620CAC1|nr:hypothetical protein [Clostridium sp.]